MSAGSTLLLVVISAFLALMGLQRLAARRARALEGQPVPQLPGALGQAIQTDTLVWFHSPTCAPCKRMEPTIQELVAQGSAIEVDVSRNLDAAKAFGVMATPTTIQIRNGRVLAVRQGVLPTTDLLALARR